MIRTRPNGRAIRPRPEPLEPRALLSADYGQWPLRGADPTSTLLVKFADAPSSPVIRAALSTVSGYIGKTFEDGTSLVNLGQGVDGTVAMAMLRAVPGVVFAEPNAEIQVQSSIVPNDPSFPSQWGLNQANGIDINAEAAWGTTTGSSSTIIAIVDTGIDLAHPEFAGRLWTNPVDGSHGYNFVATTNNPQDDNGHGTHVAGIIGATGNNGVGVAGVNWNAQIMAIKFLDSSGSGSTAAAISGIEWAADHGATVINASWGGGGGDPALSAAITYADSKGAVFVAAAGNNGTNNDASPFYPASYHLPNMLTVAAIDSSGNLAGFSNYGANSVDLAAPGAGIYSTYLGGYATLSGTSMATPFVTGVVSLLEGLHPTYAPAQIVAMVKAGVKPLASLQGKTVTGGMLDAAGAIAASSSITPKVQVFDGSSPISASTGVDPFGAALLGTPVTRTFTVRNGGVAPLTLADPISLPAGFALTSDFGSTTLAPGASTTFAVSLTAAAAGSYSGTLSFATNDPTNPTFGFTVSGNVSATVGPSTIVDDSSASGFATVGTWSPYPNPGYLNGIHFAVGTGADVATWSFNVTPGARYRVSATWFALSNRATNSPYTVYDGTTSDGTTAVNQQLSPTDFTDAGVGWKDLGYFTMTSNSLEVSLSDNANHYVIADAVRVQLVNSIVATPQAQVFDGSTQIASTGSDAFGSTPVGTPVARTFTVKNNGTAPLTLVDPISLPAGFALANDFGSTTLAPGASTSFGVRLTAASAGSYSGSITFGTNDPSNPTFSFGVAGIVAPTSQQISSSDPAGFSMAGSWTRDAFGTSGRSIEYAIGTGADVATWSFTVAPGNYLVSTSWALPTLAGSPSSYSVFDGPTVVAPVSPSTASTLPTPGEAWSDLGTFTVSGTVLKVTLSDAINAFVIADAVRILKV
jgi:hypothetical protein